MARCAKCEELAADANASAPTSTSDLIAFLYEVLCSLDENLGNLGGGGGPATGSVSTQSIVAVGVVSTPVLPAIGVRVGGWVKNISDNYIWVSFGVTASASAPTQLAPGQVLEFGTDSWVWQGAVSAIQTTGGTLNLEVVDILA